MKQGAVRVIEAAYRWKDRERDWIAGIVEASRTFDVGGGVFAYTVDLCAPKTVVPTAFSTPEAGTAGVARVLSTFTEGFDRTLARKMYAPTEFAGNSAWRIARLVPKQKAPLPSAWIVIGGDPTSRAVALGFPSPGAVAADAPYPRRRASRQLGLVGAHLGAALRLRVAVGPPAPEDPATEAVLTPDGRVLHATGAAVARRSSLAEAVRRSERARRRGVSDDEALSLWEALVDGRWTVIDVEERDGKRLLLARKNDLTTGDVKGLDADERDVAWLVAMGHSSKFIAYEVGRSVQTIERTIARVLAKLGFASRRDLVRFFAAS